MSAPGLTERGGWVRGLMARIAATVLLCSVAWGAIAQPGADAAAPTHRVFERIDSERSLALLALDDIIRHNMGYVHAVLGGRSVDVEVDPFFDGGCGSIGNPALSFDDRGSYRIRLCFTSIHALRQVTRGMNHLLMEASQNLAPEQVQTTFPVWKRNFVEAEVGFYASVLTSALTGSPWALPPACNSGAVVAYLVVQGRPARDCETADAALLPNARAWARGHLARVYPAMKDANGDRDALQVETEAIQRAVFNYVIAHEIGHLLPQPDPAARADGNPVTEALMKEIVADAFVMQTPVEGTELVMDALSAIWEALRVRGRRDAPEAQHITIRRNAMEMFAPCRRVDQYWSVPSAVVQGRSRDEESLCLVLQAAFAARTPELRQHLKPRARPAP